MLISGVVAGADKPNIVFILSDDIGVGDIKCYYPPSKVATPNIDQLASQGMRFTQAYAPGSVCSPSRYGLLTGAYPCRGPLRSKAARASSPLTMGEEMLTLPRFLKNIGYSTAHIGKWHLGYGKTDNTNWAGEIKPGPNDIGFDYHLGLPANHNDNFKTYVENHKLLWLKNDVTELREAPTIDQLTQIRYDDEVDTTLTSKAIEFITENKEQPFFVYLALVATHTHITPHAKFRGTSEIGQLGDYIHELDHHVGEIMDTLETLNLADNTILIFSSDNGGSRSDFSGSGKNLNLRDESNDVAEKSKTAKEVARATYGHRTNGNLSGYKGDTNEGGLRVPYIVRWPKHVVAGAESDQLISLVDVLATTAGLLEKNLPESAGVDSFDLSPVLLGENLDKPIRTNIISQNGRGVLAFRDGDWKLRVSKAPKWNGDVAVLQPPFYLHNLASDPAEETNLARKHPDRVKKMGRHLEDLLKQGRSR